MEETCDTKEVGCELGGCIDEGALPDTIESLVTLDSKLADGNIFLSATSHFANAESGILQKIYHKQIT